MVIKKSNGNKALFLVVGMILLVTILGTLLLSQNVAKAEELNSSWNYPSSWTKIGGDQALVKVNATSVLKSQAFGNESQYRQGGDTHGSLTIEDINKKGYPAINIMRTFLKGYFEGNYYIAVLIDLHMSPGNNASTPDWIRSAKATIETHIYKGKKVGNFWVTYWPTTEQAGELVSYGPKAKMSSVNNTYSVEMGLQDTTDITATFSAGKTEKVDRLQIQHDPLPKDAGSRSSHGTEATYLYYRPFDDGDVYLNSSSQLKYGAIYLCDPSVEYYDISVSITGEFFYDGTGLNNAIVKAVSGNNFFIQPSTGFFKAYGL